MKSRTPDPISNPRQHGAIGRAIDRLLSGKKNSDPLYISNRTWKGWLLLGLKIGIPLAVLGGGAAWYVVFRVLPERPPGYDSSLAETGSKLRLPDLKDLRAENREVEVLEVGIERQPLALAGVVRNNSTHPIGMAEVDFDISDDGGSRLATETARFQHLAPKAEARFRFPIFEPKAKIAIVRGIRTK